MLFAEEKGPSCPRVKLGSKLANVGAEQAEFPRARPSAPSQSANPEAESRSRNLQVRRSRSIKDHVSRAPGSQQS